MYTSDGSRSLLIRTQVLRKAAIKPCVNQVECHPLLPQAKLRNFCAARGVLLTAYSPLGSPDAAYRKPEDPSLLRDERIAWIAKGYGKSAAQVLVRFQTQRGVVAIPKSQTPRYIAENLDSFDFELSDAHLEELAAMETGFRYGPNLRDKVHPLWPFHEPF